MNNVTMASRHGLGNTRKPVAGYGKPKNRPQLQPNNTSEDNIDTPSTSNNESGSTIKSNNPLPSGFKKLPRVGQPRHQGRRTFISAPASPPGSSQQDAYAFGSDDDNPKQTKPRPSLVSRTKPAAKPPRMAKVTAVPSTDHPEHDRPKRTVKGPTSLPKLPTLPSSPSPDPEPARTPRTNSIAKSIAKPISNSIAKPIAKPIAHHSRPSAPSRHSRKASNVSLSDALDTPRPVKRSAPPPSSPQTIVHRPKRRLIDELAAQADDDVDDDSSDSSNGRSSMGDGSDSDDAPPRDLYSPQPQTNPRRDAWARRTPQNKPPGVKFTYSSQRTLLSETSSLSATGVQNPLDIFALTAPSSSTFDYEEEEPESSQTGAIRSLHELRQAGASSRFTDEMNDLLDRVGSVQAKPSSMRRSALIDLVNKLKDKGFRRQFRDFGGDTRLFDNVEMETDIIAGTALVCVFLSLLGAGKATHITSKMPAKTLINMLLPLLEVAHELPTLARQRSTNLSKHGQTNFVSLGPSMKKLSIWEPMEPQSITPQILALKCLDLTVEQISDHALEGLVSSTISDKLFGILSQSLEEEEDTRAYLAAESPSSTPHELFLALTVLKICSVKAMETSSERAKWTKEHLPLVVKALHSSLRRTSADDDSKTRSLVSQVTLNMTNNNMEAAEVISNDAVLQPILSKLRDELETVSTSAAGGSFSSDALDNLVLLLGVMINFCEYSPPVRAVAVQSNTLDGLIRALLVHYQKRAEADSVDKTQVNVAFGYLSVLLSYFCLHEPARVTFKSLSSGNTLEPLFVSLREFVALHIAVEKQAGRGSGEFEQRMSTLVTQLEQDERRRNR